MVIYLTAAESNEQRNCVTLLTILEMRRSNDYKQRVSGNLQICSYAGGILFNSEPDDSGCAAACSQPVGKMVVSKRFTDVKTLGRIATQIAQYIPGHAILYALGNDLVTKIMPQVDN
jgi:hypothetical protein